MKLLDKLEYYINAYNPPNMVFKKPVQPSEFIQAIKGLFLKYQIDNLSRKEQIPVFIAKTKLKDGKVIEIMLVTQDNATHSVFICNKKYFNAETHKIDKNRIKIKIYNVKGERL